MVRANPQIWSLAKHLYEINKDCVACYPVLHEEEYFNHFPMFYWHQVKDFYYDKAKQLYYMFLYNAFTGKDNHE